LAEATSGIEGGREFAQAVQELERTKRTSELQQAEFESIKRNLMRDVTDRCEKVRLEFASVAASVEFLTMFLHLGCGATNAIGRIQREIQGYRSLNQYQNAT
jgi:hypothetical protein